MRTLWGASSHWLGSAPLSLYLCSKQILSASDALDTVLQSLLWHPFSGLAGLKMGMILALDTLSKKAKFATYLPDEERETTGGNSYPHRISSGRYEVRTWHVAEVGSIVALMITRSSKSAKSGSAQPPPVGTEYHNKKWHSLIQSSREDEV